VKQLREDIPRGVLTIGHSTRSLDEFVALLQEQQVSCLVDVRTAPRSRHNPQFNRESLPAALEAAGISYRHMPGLGGLRHTRADSPNKGWRNTSFRGYADYMQSAEFEKNLNELIALARQERVAVMCAEAVPWRCHRSLIADALLVRGLPSQDIIGKDSIKPHRLTPFARVEGTRITYPPNPDEASEVSLVHAAETQKVS
jgi:uncharacterized protein (DUF488 family)